MGLLLLAGALSCRTRSGSVSWSRWLRRPAIAKTYEVVQLMPETPSGEPQYRIKGLSSGIVRAVREAEIKPSP